MLSGVEVEKFNWLWYVLRMRFGECHRHRAKNFCLAAILPTRVTLLTQFQSTLKSIIEFSVISHHVFSRRNNEIRSFFEFEKRCHQTKTISSGSYCHTEVASLQVSYLQFWQIALLAIMFSVNLDWLISLWPACIVISSDPSSLLIFRAQTSSR